VSKNHEPRRTPETAPRKSWIAPEVKDLPRLENLTLQTGNPIDGGPSITP
jgi:hypothetical protein